MDRLDTIGIVRWGELGGVSEKTGIGNRVGDPRGRPRARLWVTRLMMGAAVTAALGGCTAELADALRSRLPGGDRVPPEAARKIGKTAGDAVNSEVMPQIVDHLGDVAFQITLKTCKPSNSPTAKRAADRVSRLIIDAVGDSPYADTGRQFTWRVEVVEDESANAIAYPGGKIIINSGLLTFAAKHGGNAADAWVATALTHEVAHALRRHVTEAVEQALGDSLDLTGAGLQLSARDLNPKQTAALLGAMGVPYEGATLISFARDKESEADHIGLLLMARAGYDPHGALDFWQQQAKDRPHSATPEFLSLHPTDATRIDQLKDWMPEAAAQLKIPHAEDGRIGLRD
jgi:metalloendopeptidase OMA1, mitochondrial